MNFKFASPIALAAALALSSTAMAQTMVGDQDVSDEDLASVQAHCETLAANEAGEFPDGTDNDAVDADTADEAYEGVNLENITVDDCRAAGLVQ